MASAETCGCSPQVASVVTALLLILAAPFAAAAVHHADFGANNSIDHATSFETVVRETSAPISSSAPQQEKIVYDWYTHLATGQSNMTFDLVGNGGGTSGVNSAGELCALSDVIFMARNQEGPGGDFSEALNALAAAQKNATAGAFSVGAFDSYYCSSVGGIVVSEAFLGGNLYRAATIFPENLDARFLDVPRIGLNLVGLGNGTPGMDLNYLKDGLTGGFGPDKEINVTALWKNIQSNDTPSVYIVATNFTTLNTTLIDARTASSPDVLLSLIMAACNNLGVAGDVRYGIFDADGSGETCPIDQASGDIVFVLSNTPEGKFGDQTLPEKAMSFAVASLAIQEAGSIDRFLDIVKANLDGNARNDKVVREAEAQKGKYVFLSPSPDSAKVSSSTVDKETLRGALVDSYLNTKGKMLVDGINSGFFKASPNATYFLRVPAEFGASSTYLRLKTDSRGRASGCLVTSVEIRRELKNTKEKSLKFSTPMERIVDRAVLSPMRREANRRDKFSAPYSNPSKPLGKNLLRPNLLNIHYR